MQSDLSKLVGSASASAAGNITGKNVAKLVTTGKDNADKNKGEAKLAQRPRTAGNDSIIVSDSSCNPDRAVGMAKGLIKDLWQDALAGAKELGADLIFKPKVIIKTALNGELVKSFNKALAKLDDKYRDQINELKKELKKCECRKDLSKETKGQIEAGMKGILGLKDSGKLKEALSAFTGALKKANEGKAADIKSDQAKMIDQKMQEYKDIAKDQKAADAVKWRDEFTKNRPDYVDPSKIETEKSPQAKMIDQKMQEYKDIAADQNTTAQTPAQTNEAPAARGIEPRTDGVALALKKIEEGVEELKKKLEAKNKEAAAKATRDSADKALAELARKKADAAKEALEAARRLPSTIPGGSLDTVAKLEKEAEEAEAVAIKAEAKVARTKADDAKEELGKAGYLPSETLKKRTDEVKKLEDEAKAKEARTKADDAKEELGKAGYLPSETLKKRTDEVKKLDDEAKALEAKVARAKADDAKKELEEARKTKTSEEIKVATMKADKLETEAIKAEAKVARTKADDAKEELESLKKSAKASGLDEPIKKELNDAIEKKEAEVKKLEDEAVKAEAKVAK